MEHTDFSAPAQILTVERDRYTVLLRCEDGWTVPFVGGVSFQDALRICRKYEGHIESDALTGDLVIMREVAVDVIAERMVSNAKG